MERTDVKNFKQPDEVRPFKGKGHAEILKFEGGTVGRGIYEPGWKWSEHVKPIAGTDSCMSRHELYVVSGRLHVRMSDGTGLELGPGDVALIQPDHDAWVVGNEACVLIDFSGMERYALPARPSAAREEAPAPLH